METLKLLEWNINQRSSGRKIPEFIADEILAKNPDVIILVEFKGEDNLAMLKKKLSNYYIASYDGIIVPNEKNKEERIGNGILIGGAPCQVDNQIIKIVMQLSERHDSGIP
ncbi:hypothetical protein EFS32_10830, partial [Levilactobacillus parabrevis]|nr:hypothetical protein [Levilactobacillus parabrevis]